MWTLDINNTHLIRIDTPFTGFVFMTEGKEHNKKIVTLEISMQVT